MWYFCLKREKNILLIMNIIKRSRVFGKKIIFYNQNTEIKKKSILFSKELGWFNMNT